VGEEVALTRNLGRAGREVRGSVGGITSCGGCIGGLGVVMGEGLRNRWFADVELGARTPGRS